MSSARLARPSRPVQRAAAVGVLSLSLLGFSAATADAHVRVHADSTAAGSFSQLTFRVPNESPTAGTVKVEVQLPQDKPFLFVSVKPVTGWKTDVQEAKLPQPIESEGTTITKAARTVTWTADKGTQIAPGQYQEFSISAGPLPDPTELLLPALQTYSDGEVVKWDQPTPASGEEPEHPAPALEVVAAASTEEGAASTSPSSAASPAAADSSAPASSTTAAASAGSPDTTARVLGGLGVLLGVVAVAVAALGRRRGARA